jgi:hypothetical protein
MYPENMPYYHRPCIQKPFPDIESADTLYIQGLLSDLVVLDGRGHTILSNHPVRFEQLQPSLPNTGLHARALLNSESAGYAHETTNFDWAVYYFSNEHFSSTVESKNLPFTI